MHATSDRRFRASALCALPRVKKRAVFLTTLENI
jgi:hypothetical protein